MTQAPIAISCGDPAGIGPEILLKSWQALGASHPFYVYGDAAHFASLASRLKLSVVEIQSAQDAVAAFQHGIPVIDLPFAADVELGQPDARNAPVIIEAIRRGVQDCLHGDAHAICTAPISKEILRASGEFPHPGHTEYLAELCEVQRPVMMLASDQLKVVPATIHIPLTNVSEQLTQELLSDTIDIVDKGLKTRFGLENPRIAISGLNPHAGENGHMGLEEQTIIQPVIEQKLEQGLSLAGPLPADTMFHARARANYDAAICMYHDQALIPIKTLDFDNGVNLTLGLPIIRTSPDHGTAFDIAKNLDANPSSMIEAIKLAQRLLADG